MVILFKENVSKTEFLTFSDILMSESISDEVVNTMHGIYHLIRNLPTLQSTSVLFSSRCLLVPSFVYHLSFYRCKETAAGHNSSGRNRWRQTGTVHTDVFSKAGEGSHDGEYLFILFSFILNTALLEVLFW